MAFLKRNTDLSPADREIFIAVWQISEVSRLDPSNKTSQMMAVKRFFKLVMRKFGITDRNDEEALSRALDQVERDIIFPEDQLTGLVKQLI